MSPTHLLLALLVVAIWGTNFAIIKIGLETWPPLLFVTLRFALSALPLFILPRPRAPLGSVIAYGLLLGVGQFGVLFYAMQHDISPGLAALVIQMQVFFTIALSSLLYREQIGRLQLLGLSLALAGMVVISWNVGSSGGGAVLTLRGLLLVLFAASCWAAANLVVKRLGTVDVLSLVAWSSVWPAVVLALLSVLLEGPREIAAALRAAGTSAWLAAAWQAVGNTLLGFGAWSWLLARHPAATVTPMALLVPVFGLGASAVLLAEPLEPWKIAAATLVLAGLGIIVWASIRVSGRRFTSATSPPASPPPPR